MFNLFNKKSPIEKLQAQYKALMAESHQLSQTNRKAADEKYAAAEAVAKEIDALKKGV